MIVERLMVLTLEGLREATEADAAEWRRQQEQAARNEAELAQIRAELDARRIYPCRACGKLRSKAEGGTVFTVCDECWSCLHPPTVTD